MSIKVIYYFLISACYNAIIFSQGIDLSNEPVQASVSGLSLFIAVSTLLTYRRLKKQRVNINRFYSFLIKGFIFYFSYIFFYHYLLTDKSEIELKFINLQVIISSILIKFIGIECIYDKNVLMIEGSKPVAIMHGCNFFEHLHNILFFFFSFPASKRRMYKYISICLIYLSFIQIFRIMSFAFCLKYFPNHWDIVHVYSSYLFYYPGILTLWYFYSRKQNIFA